MKVTNLGEFKAQLRKADGLTALQLRQLGVGVALEVGKNMSVGGDYSPGTPVDTGFARASWYMSFDNPSMQTLAPGAARDPVGDAVTMLPGFTLGQMIWWSNNTEYIEPLEFGHSNQAPGGFVRLTLEAGQRILDKMIARLFPNGG